MRRTVYTVNLFPRENVHASPSLARDVWDVVKFATLGGLLWVIVMLVMSG